ncbi:hypothetical protein ACP4OV_004488 [Aristida adscensionis]
MAAQQEEPGCSRSCCCGAVTTVIVVVTVIVLLSVYVFPSKPAAYSVAVAGVAGLDPAADLSGRAALSPVLNVTVRIDNARDRLGGACIGPLSTVAVSYGDAVLGRGSVPAFCAGVRRVRERGARAWGQDVAVPRFLREQLAGELAVGEAAVDVRVTTPGECFHCGDQVLICSKAKIGGGPAPCRWETVYA